MVPDKPEENGKENDDEREYDEENGDIEINGEGK